jgi:hypothetical protein
MVPPVKVVSLRDPLLGEHGRQATRILRFTENFPVTVGEPAKLMGCPLEHRLFVPPPVFGSYYLYMVSSLAR